MLGCCCLGTIETLDWDHFGTRSAGCMAVVEMSTVDSQTAALEWRVLLD